MAGEHVILLDEQDKPTGMLEKYAAHTLDTPLHLAFSCWLFNEQGQLLVTRRSLGKKPGQAYGRIQSAGIRKPAKPSNRPLSAAAALSSASR
ncbi:isopentenyl-diphosphate delta-isomerase [Klebsiella michiganensis]|uniref:Isopentenyl-diphosphate delta-isomerase n=1 Tax=Klebsiella michiganensis TaxID=1134687 RepID=A0A7H4M6E7_9ENTR|nr:isopentenyl-diphosphate delta-isomerase [Klebsiella michiganensis]